MSAISVSAARTLLDQNKDDSLPEVGDALFLTWMKFINRYAYNQFNKLAPNKILTKKTYNVVTGTAAYSLPTDFKQERTGLAGMLETSSGTVYQLLKYDALVSSFTVAGTLTGGTSAATGTIVEVEEDSTTGWIVLSGVSGTFADDEALTDSATGSATANGAPEGYAHTSTVLTRTNFGSSLVGYWMDSSNINITPQGSVSSDIYVFRYIPKLANLTGDSSETVFQDDDESEEMLESIVSLFYEQWKSTGSGGRINLADAQFLRSLNQVFTEYFPQPKVFTIG